MIIHGHTVSQDNMLMKVSLAVKVTALIKKTYANVIKICVKQYSNARVINDSKI
jgi:hypothetical protein